MTPDLAPADLRCDYLVNPLGIDVARPRLSWTLRAERRAQRQSAYQIIAGSSAEGVRNGASDVWDSGKVESGQSAHVAYSGPPLQSGQRCWWAVRVWDGDGVVSPYSEPAWWEVSLLHPEDWRAQWIGLELGASGPTNEQQDTDLDLPPSPYLRTTFTPDPARRVVGARLYATARGLYEARLNGHRVGDALLAPGWTDYRQRIQYQTYDVTDLVEHGENALGAILGTGWYCGYVGFGHQNKHYGDRPQFLAQLRLDYDDGTSETIVSDASWRGTTGPIVYSDMLMGETYDARRELAGWDRPGYDDGAWAAVASAARDGVRLEADRAEPILAIDELAPRAVTRLDADTQIVDLGQNMVGWVRLSVAGAAGTRLRLRFAEVLNPDGTLYTTNLRSARQTDTYVLKGAGEEVYEPHFTFHGFRYVEVTGYPGDLPVDAITGIVVGSATPPAGTFACSSELVNQLQHNIVWGQRGNFLSVPTDCPQRDERLGWLGDAQIFARTATCNADVAAFFTKWMRDVTEAQSREGAFPDVAPRLVDLADGAPAWGDAGVIVPWTLYQVYGDTRIVEEHYAAMAHWLDYMGEANPDHLWRNRRNNDFGDWLALDGEAVKNPGASATPKDLLATAYWAYDTGLLARMARALGRDDDASRYEDLFARIKDAFIAAYVSGDGRIAGETQTGYVLALHMDLLPGELRATAARHLVESIAAQGWHLVTGFVGVGYLCLVLTEAGYADVAYRLLLNETFPSWGYSIRHGATTIWERWDGWTDERGFQDPGMNSFNHYSMGSVGEWLYRYVAGIDTDSERPGYEHIVIRPHLGGELAWARASYTSMRGPIESAWRRDGDALQLRVSIPANTAATVYLPVSGAMDAAAITESGRVLDDAPGVAPRGVEGDRFVVDVGSGDYDFRCTGLRATAAAE